MRASGNGRGWTLSDLLRAVVLGLFGLFTLGLVTASALALAGQVPWLRLTGEAAAQPDAGRWLQLGLTLMACALFYGLTAHLRPEPGPRSFAMAIEDGILARRMTPDSDRAGPFAPSPDPDPRLHRARVFLHRHPSAIEALSEELDLAQNACDTLRLRLAEIEAAQREARAQLRSLTGAPDPGLRDNVIRLADRVAAARTPVRPERPAPRR